MIRLVRLRHLVLLSAATFVVGFGCSSDNGLNLAKVRGKVTYKGEPVKNGTVFFMPDDSKGTVGPPAVGTITANGTFIMSTESAGDGVIVGSHKIGITGVEEKPVGSGTAAATPESDAKGYMNAKAKDAAVARRRGQEGGGNLHRQGRPEVAIRRPQEVHQSSRIWYHRQGRAGLQYHELRHRRLWQRSY